MSHLSHAAKAGVVFALPASRVLPHLRPDNHGQAIFRVPHLSQAGPRRDAGNHVRNRRREVNRKTSLLVDGWVGEWVGRFFGQPDLVLKFVVV